MRRYSECAAQVGGRDVEGWGLFKAGIKPEWEDQANAGGMRLVESVPSVAEGCRGLQAVSYLGWAQA